MDRRRFVRAAGAAAVVGLAGCLGGDDEDDQLRADEPEEYPDGVDGGETNGTNDNGYELYTTSGQDVPLAPTDDAYEWYQSGDLVVADARSQAAYDRIHIEGAVWSPAPAGQQNGDPLADVATDRRILTYCTCPHHLSGSRAASLLAEGYENVYALDKGLNDWIQSEYPIAGERVD